MASLMEMHVIYQTHGFRVAQWHSQRTFFQTDTGILELRANQSALQPAYDQIKWPENMTSFSKALPQGCHQFDKP